MYFLTAPACRAAQHRSRSQAPQTSSNPSAIGIKRSSQAQQNAAMTKRHHRDGAPVPGLAGSAGRTAASDDTAPARQLRVTGWNQDGAARAARERWSTHPPRSPVHSSAPCQLSACLRQGMLILTERTGANGSAHATRPVGEPAAVADRLAQRPHPHRPLAAERNRRSSGGRGYPPARLVYCAGNPRVYVY